MEFELHLLAPIRDVGIIHSLHKHGPRMSMIRRCALWLWIVLAEQPRTGTVDKGSEYLHAFDALLIIGWCHFLDFVRRYNLSLACSLLVPHRARDSGLK